MSNHTSVEWALVHYSVSGVQMVILARDIKNGSDRPGVTLSAEFAINFVLQRVIGNNNYQLLDAGHSHPYPQDIHGPSGYYPNDIHTRNHDVDMQTSREYQTSPLVPSSVTVSFWIYDDGNYYRYNNPMAGPTVLPPHHDHNTLFQ